MQGANACRSLKEVARRERKHSCAQFAALESTRKHLTKIVKFYYFLFFFRIVIKIDVYVLRNFFSIVDVDECLSPNACGSEHVCNNTFGSYACECPLGYVADSGLQNPLDPVCVGEEIYINI